MFIVLMAAMSLAYETSSGIAIIKSAIDLLPDYALSFVQPQIDAIFARPSINMISFAFLGTIWTTSSSVEGMRTIFNKIYHVKMPHFFLITRLIGILQFMALVLLAVIIVATIIILPQIVHKLESILHISLPNMDYPVLNTILVLIILSYTVSVVYYTLTNKKMMFIEVIPGAILTVLLWYLSIYLMTYYLQNLSDFNIVYGSVTGVIITLVFFYIVNIVLIYGAAFNYTLKKYHPQIFESHHICYKILNAILLQRK